MKKNATISLLFLALLLVTACDASDFEETFDEQGSWRAGDDLDASGKVEDGVYKLIVEADAQRFWTTAGESFENGVFTVEVTQVRGPLDTAGFGMLFRVDDEADSFYIFEISGDGFAWIGRCLNACTEEQVLVENWWFEASAINQGLDATNMLTVSAEGGNFAFAVNGIEIGRVTDNVLAAGDIGLFVETLGLGGIEVHFDNFTVTPLEN